MPFEYVLGLLAAAVGSLFLTYQRGHSAALASKDTEIARLVAVFEAEILRVTQGKDEDIAWLRKRDDAWVQLTRTMLESAERERATP